MTQKITSVFFVSVDIMLITQKGWFARQDILVLLRPALVVLGVVSSPSIVHAYQEITLLKEEASSSHTVGLVLGWLSACIYLNSRIPQIIKNYKRESTKGLSRTMFVNAIMGNLTYGLGKCEIMLLCT